MQEEMIEVLEGYGEWACGLDSAETAAEWIAAGFTPSEADGWLEANFWNAAAAANARDTGVIPEDVDGELAYSYCNGDATLEDLLAPDQP